MGSSWEPEASCCCMCVLILSREDWVQGDLFQAGASREIVFGPRLNLSLALSSLSVLFRLGVFPVVSVRGFVCVCVFCVWCFLRWEQLFVLCGRFDFVPSLFNSLPIAQAWPVVVVVAAQGLGFVLAAAGVLVPG